MRRDTSQTLPGCANRFGLAALLCLAAGSLLSAPAHAAFPGANGKIAFTSTRDGNNEIYTMNPDGTALTRLTNNSAYDAAPRWSPDGTKIAFHSLRDGNYEIYTMNADGTNQTRLTNNAPVDDVGPAWSPNGTKITFATTRFNTSNNFDIYVMNADGTNPIQLTTDPELDGSPAWSPDGQKIAFTSNRNTNSEVYVMNADGTNQTRLTFGGSQNFLPAWSPDGQKVAFESTRDGNNEIYTMSPDGSGQTNVTNNGASDVFPGDWSPDGTKLVFNSDRDSAPNNQLYTMNADGTAQTMLPNTVATDEQPDWQPLPVNPFPTAPYPTLASASHVDVSLVPAYRQTTTNAQCSARGGTPTTHAAPFSVSSCNPPAFLPGMAAFFGRQAVGSTRLTVVPGNPFTTADEADVSIVVNLSDIRSGSLTGADYNPNPSGTDVTLLVKLRISDLRNGASESDPGTTADLVFSVPVDCSDTAEPAIGATCAVNTTADSVMPGAVKEGKQAVFSVFRVHLKDSGANGVRGDSDDKEFAQQGIFSP